MTNGRTIREPSGSAAGTEMTAKTRLIGWLVLGALLATACGPTLSTQVRLETVRAPENTGSISKEGLTVEIPEAKGMPPQLVVNVATCGPNGPITDVAIGTPMMRDITVIPVGSELYQLKITNQTDHIVRLQGSVIRLFDPADNQVEPLSKEDAAAASVRGLGEHGICPQEAAKVQGAYATIKFIGTNTELLPGTTTTGFMVFMPLKNDLTGVWKLSMYEVPVKVDATGTPIARTRFDFPYVRRRYVDSYSQDFAGAKTLVSSTPAP